jgi:hypothetical protein
MVAVRTPTAAGTGRLRWVDLAGLGFLTVALRLPAFLASAHLTFDDGVYGASAVAMRAGGQPFRDVFSSQGPLFLPLVYVADAIGLRTANAPRVLSLAAALLLVGATYVAGRTVTDRGGACLAAGLVDAGRWAVSPDVVLLVWVGAGLLVLLTEHPMWRPHVSQLIPGLALLAARHRPSWRVLAVAGVVALPYYVVHAWPMLHPEGYEGSAARAVDLLEDLPEEALAISDEPGLVWRSGHRTPPDLVDASVLRIETGDLTGRSVAAAAADTDVCAVVVTSRARWGRFEDLPRRLDALGYDIAHDAGRHDRVYLRAACPAG